MHAKTYLTFVHIFLAVALSYSIILLHVPSCWFDSRHFHFQLLPPKEICSITLQDAQNCDHSQTVYSDTFHMSQQASMRRANLSHAQQSKLRAEDRRREILREENMKRLAAEKLLDANMASEERVENKRFLCRLQLEAREREMEEALFRVRGNNMFECWHFTILYACVYVFADIKVLL